MIWKEKRGILGKRKFTVSEEEGSCICNYVFYATICLTIRSLLYPCTYCFLPTTFLRAHLPVWCTPAPPDSTLTCLVCSYTSLQHTYLFGVLLHLLADARDLPRAALGVFDLLQQLLLQLNVEWCQPLVLLAATFNKSSRLNTFQLLLSNTTINLVLWMGHCIFLSLHFLSLMAAVQR